MKQLVVEEAVTAAHAALGGEVDAVMLASMPLLQQPVLLLLVLLLLTDCIVAFSALQGNSDGVMLANAKPRH
jgi:hypothetical protein